LVIWLFGYLVCGNLINTERIKQWSDELGIGESNQTLVIIVMVFLILTVGVIKNLGSTLGKEIGWRVFLIFELRKVMSLKSLTVVSVIISTIYHFPVINLMFGSGEYLLLHMSAFTVMIIGVSVILAYYTFKSNSLWRAAVYHSIHNIYIQKICTPVTISNDNTIFWIDEYGLMIPIVMTILIVNFWRKAEK
jgi:membrane protease YdiL (CAAX protease family)